jgi:anti-sigma factor RsiW
MPKDQITDEELIRYLDGEVTDADRSALAARLAADAGSSARLQILQQRSARLSTWLVGADPAELDVRRSAHVIRPQIEQARAAHAYRPTMWKAAAAIILLFGLAFAVPPVRAWIVERALDAAETMGWRAAQPDASLPATPAAVSEDAGPALTVSIAVSRDTFEVQVARPGGRLVVVRETRTSASAEPPAAAGIVATTNTLRIEGNNPAASTFTLRLPERVTVLRIRHDGQAAATHVLPAPGQELQISLAR